MFVLYREQFGILDKMIMVVHNLFSTFYGILVFPVLIHAFDVSFFTLVIFWFICLFGVYRPTREFFTHVETSPLPVKGCKF